MQYAGFLLLVGPVGHGTQIIKTAPFAHQLIPWAIYNLNPVYALGINNAGQLHRKYQIFYRLFSLSILFNLVSE